MITKKWLEDYKLKGEMALDFKEENIMAYNLGKIILLLIKEIESNCIDTPEVNSQIKDLQKDYENGVLNFDEYSSKVCALGYNGGPDSKNETIDESKLTRLTVVAKDVGRIIEKWNVKINISIQDNDRTLKIFFEDN